MVKTTLKPGDLVVIYGLLVNSERRTMRGVFIKEILHGERAGLYLIQIDNLHIAVEPRKVRKDG